LSSPIPIGGKRILEDNMKKLVLAAALTAAATTAMAGGLADPVVEPVVIEEVANGSSAGVWVPLFLLAVVAAAVAAGS
jgi:hypothetical protein